MRTSVVAAGIAGGLALGAGFVACGAQTPPEGRLPAASANPTSSASAPPAIASAASPIADAGPDPSDADLLASAVAAAKACAVPESEITNQPDGGVVFNNAMTSADAGNIDRTQGVIDALAAKSGAFRCCFDLWIRDHADKTGKLLLVVELAAGGEVKKAAVDAARSDVDHPLLAECVASVARDVTYPKSPTGKATVVEFPFRFRKAP